MKLIKNETECRAWIINEFFNLNANENLFSDDEIELAVEDMMPKKFPCAIYVSMSDDGASFGKLHYISKEEIIAVYREIEALPSGL